MFTVGVEICPDDLACIVDAGCKGAVRGVGIVQGGEHGGVAAPHEAMGAARIAVIPNDRAYLVDAAQYGVCTARGTIEAGREPAVETHKAVEAVGVPESPDDDPVVVDA